MKRRNYPYIGDKSFIKCHLWISKYLALHTTALDRHYLEKKWSKTKSAENATKKLPKTAQEGSIGLGMLVMDTYYISYVLCN